jgi:hypothetical protein
MYRKELSRLVLFKGRMHTPHMVIASNFKRPDASVLVVMVVVLVINLARLWKASGYLLVVWIRFRL